MISSAEVAKLAHSLGVGDRVIEKDYVLSWLLVAIAESGLKPALAFKGGTALKRVYYPDYRFSEDLDFTFCADLSHEGLVSAFEALWPALARRVNLTLALHSAEQSVLGSTTLLVDYVGPLRARLGSRQLKVDITRGERLLYPLTERPLHAPYSDFPVGVKALAYTLEEILTEKLCALIGRVEPRDLYDVYCLLEAGDVEMASLPASFVAKCQHKGYDPARLEDVMTRRVETVRRLWQVRLAVQVVDLPHVDAVVRTVQRHLRRWALI